MKPPEKSIFAPNINATGRLIRGGAGVLCLIALAFAWHVHTVLAIVLAVSAAFLLFEALRGWCALRACRIKTPF